MDFFLTLWHRGAQAAAALPPRKVEPMKRLALLVAVGFLVLPVATYAGSRGGGSHSSSKSKSKSGEKKVHVKEHTKKDGTHVDAYDRSAPKPGKCGTVARDS